MHCGELLLAVVLLTALFGKQQDPDENQTHTPLLGFFLCLFFCFHSFVLTGVGAGVGTSKGHPSPYLHYS